MSAVRNVKLPGATSGGPNAVVGELAEGRLLAQLIVEQGPLPVEQYVPILVQLLDALGAIHAAGKVHGNLCPERVMVTQGDTSEVVKLVEARAGGRGADHPYASPEEAAGGAIDHRSDIYSFGVIVYELLCGRLPFEPGTVASVEAAARSGPAPTPGAVLQSPGGRALDTIARRCLREAPAERFASVGEVADNLRRVVSEVVGGEGYSVPEDWTYEPPRSPQRRWAVVGAVGLLLLGGGGLLVARMDRAGTPAVVASRSGPAPKPVPPVVPAAPVAVAPVPTPAVPAPPPAPPASQPAELPRVVAPAPPMAHEVPPPPAPVEARPEPAEVVAAAEPQPKMARIPDEHGTRAVPARSVRHTAQTTGLPRPVGRVEPAPSNPAKTSTRKALNHEATVDPFN